MRNNILISLQVWRSCWIIDECDEQSDEEDSTLTPPTPGATDIMKGAAALWSKTADNLKGAWKRRADYLNARPVSDGTLTAVPVEVTDEVVKESLSAEWRHIVSMLRGTAINSSRRQNDGISHCYKLYCSGNERVLLHNQAYCSFFLTHALKVSIFGSPLFCSLLEHKVVYRKMRVTAVYFYSHKRVSEIMKLGGLSGSKFYKNEMVYMLCPRANLMNVRGKSIVGYIMDEERNNLMIKVEGKDELVVVTRPDFDGENGKFDYFNMKNSSVQDPELTVSEIWPIQMKLNKSGQCAITMSSYCYSANDDNDDIFII